MLECKGRILFSFCGGDYGSGRILDVCRFVVNVYDNLAFSIKTIFKMIIMQLILLFYVRNNNKICIFLSKNDLKHKHFYIFLLCFFLIR